MIWLNDQHTIILLLESINHTEKNSHKENSLNDYIVDVIMFLIWYDKSSIYRVLNFSFVKRITKYGKKYNFSKSTNIYGNVLTFLKGKIELKYDNKTRKFIHLAIRQ